MSNNYFLATMHVKMHVKNVINLINANYYTVHELFEDLFEKLINWICLILWIWNLDPQFYYAIVLAIFCIIRIFGPIDFEIRKKWSERMYQTIKSTPSMNLRKCKNEMLNCFFCFSILLYFPISKRMFFVFSSENWATKWILKPIKNKKLPTISSLFQPSL